MADVRKKLEVLTITGKMKCLTGIMICGYAGTKRIGGVDNPVIRDPLTDLPYIPGSSLKGKLRSLYEMAYGLFEENGDPHRFKPDCVDKKCKVCRVFGSIEASRAGNKKENNQKGKEEERTRSILKSTRLIVRDAFLDEDSKEMLENYREKTGLNYTEIKTENYINRLNSKATPRTFERIPAGVSFNVEMSLKVYEDDEKEELLDVVRESIKLLEKDYIGASGSRGYGRVKFENLEIIDEEGNRTPLFG